MKQKADIKATNGKGKKRARMSVTGRQRRAKVIHLIWLTLWGIQAVASLQIHQDSLSSEDRVTKIPAAIETIIEGI